MKLELKQFICETLIQKYEMKCKDMQEFILLLDQKEKEIDQAERRGRGRKKKENN